MRAIDTNVRVRLIAQDDAAQFQAAESFITGGVWVSTVAFIESIWVLRSFYKLKPKELATAIELLLMQRDLSFENRAAIEAALQLFMERPTLGFNDCMILKLAEKAGHLPLGTFDKDLSKLEGARKL